MVFRDNAHLDCSASNNKVHTHIKGGSRNWKKYEKWMKIDPCKRPEISFYIFFNLVISNNLILRIVNLSQEWY